MGSSPASPSTTKNRLCLKMQHREGLVAYKVKHVAHNYGEVGSDPARPKGSPEQSGRGVCYRAHDPGEQVRILPMLYVFRDNVRGGGVGCDSVWGVPPDVQVVRDGIISVYGRIGRGVCDRRLLRIR